MFWILSHLANLLLAPFTQKYYFYSFLYLITKIPILWLYKGSTLNIFPKNLQKLGDEPWAIYSPNMQKHLIPCLQNFGVTPHFSFCLFPSYFSECKANILFLVSQGPRHHHNGHTHLREFYEPIYIWFTSSKQHFTFLARTVFPKYPIDQLSNLSKP